MCGAVGMDQHQQQNQDSQELIPFACTALMLHAMLCSPLQCALAASVSPFLGATAVARALPAWCSASGAARAEAGRMSSKAL